MHHITSIVIMDTQSLTLKYKQVKQKKMFVHNFFQ